MLRIKTALPALREWRDTNPQFAQASSHESMDPIMHQDTTVYEPAIYDPTIYVTTIDDQATFHALLGRRLTFNEMQRERLNQQIEMRNRSIWDEG